MGVMMDMMARLGGHLVELEVIEYALDGLDDAARVKAEEHLRQCDLCRKAVRGAMDLQDGLALAAGLADIPDGLAERVVRWFRARREGRKDGEIL